MQDCVFLMEVVLISKVGNKTYVFRFPCSKVLPFCSPLRVITTVLLLFTFRIVVFADHLTIRKFWTGT